MTPAGGTGTVSRIMVGIRSRGITGQAVIAVVGVVALVGAALAALFGSGSPARAVPLRDGAAWVQSLATGSLERLDTGSGAVGYRITTPAASAPLDIVDDGTTTVLRDPATGAIRSIDLSGAKAKLTDPVDLARTARLVSGAGRTFVLQAEQGAVSGLDAATMTVGEPVNLGGPLGSAAIDGAGTLWVSLPSQGAAMPVSANGGRLTPGERAIVGEPGDKIDITVSAGAAYAVDRAGGRLLRLDPGHASPIASVPADAVVAEAQGDPADGQIVVGDPAGAVLRIDPHTGSTTRYELPDRARHDLAAPVQSRNRIAVPDRTTGELIVIDPATGSSEAAAIRGKPGQVSVIAADGAVVANDPASPTAVVVTPAGAAEVVSKDGKTPGKDEPAPAPAPAVPSVLPLPVPQPAPAPSPAVPAASPATTTTTTPVLKPPGEPISLRSAGGAAQVTLSWQASASGGPATSFVITKPDGSTVVARQGEATKSVPAPNGTAATFTIRAENQAGRSRDVAFPAATPQSQVPGPPVGLKAVASDRRIGLTWAPGAANGTTILGYRIVARDGTTVDVPGAATTAALTGLTNGTDYAPLAISTLARTSGGADVVSPAATATATAVPYGKPRAPVGGSAAPGNGSLTVSFPSADANGDPVTGYDLTITPGGVTRRVAPTGGPVVDTFGGLKNGTRYTVTATATNRAGSGPPSSPVGGTPRDKPTVKLGAESSTQTSISLEFTVDGNGSAPDACWYRLDQGSRSGTPCSKVTVSGLKAGTGYSLRVGAHNAAGDSAEESTSIRTDAPPPPKYYETTANNPLPTKTWRFTNASVQGPDIQQNTKVEVSCRKSDPRVTSNKGGWWYKVTSSPWNDGYWAPAGDFDNGGPTVLWDPGVPVC